MIKLLPKLPRSLRYMRDFWAIIFFVSSMLFFIVTNSSHNIKKTEITNLEVQEVFNNLKKQTGMSDMIPDLRIENDDTIINAYANHSEIVIYSGIIKKVNHIDEIAYVLGHEIGHVMMDHEYLPEGLRDQTILEGNADKYSIYLMMRAGYNVCYAKDLWEKLRDSDGDIVGGGTHPNYSYRIWELTFKQCN